MKAKFPKYDSSYDYTSIMWFRSADYTIINHAGVIFNIYDLDPTDFDISYDSCITYNDQGGISLCITV